MSQPPDPERYLELFDELNLDNMEDRRIGFHLLRNYFSTVLTEIGEEKLGAMGSLNNESLQSQWGKVQNKLERVPGQVPGELESLVGPIVKARNSVTHNDRHDPRENIEDLQKIRDKAPEWRREVEQSANAYFHAWEDLSPKEALIDLAEQNLQQVLASEPQFGHFDDEYREIQIAAEEAEKTLEQKTDPNRERIEKELVEVVRTVQKLKNKLSKLKKEEVEYEDYLMNTRDEMLGR